MVLLEFRCGDNWNDFKSLNTVLCLGDFNCVYNPYDDKIKTLYQIMQSYRGD